MSKILSSLVFLALIPSVAVAQITPDSSLGTENSVVETNGNRDTIKGGAVRDANLFHSFQEFNVEALREAYFNNPNGIANIFSRVTGNNISDIQGVLGVLGNANLYLINPNGILFGENARLDVNGSFFASTADSVVFGNGLEFSAVNPDAPPLLTINIPIGLRFRDNPAPITNRSVADEVGLQVDTGKTLALMGGEINFEGGKITAPGSNIELGGLLATGTIIIEENFQFSFPEGVDRANISFANFARINVASDGGGAITINAGNIDLSGESQLRGGITSGVGSPNAQAGDITLDAKGAVNLSEDSDIRNLVNRNATGNSGNIEVTADSLTLTGGSAFIASTLGRGNAGSVEITASDTITIDGETSRGFPSSAANQVAPGAKGNSGGVTITTGSLTLTNGGVVDASTFGRGSAGSVEITAKDTITIDGEILSGFPSGVVSLVNRGAEGDAGGVTIATGSLTLTNGGRVSASTGGRGDAGLVEITARDTITFDGKTSGGNSSSANSGVASGAEGNSEGVKITTGSLTLTNGGRVSASTDGRGKAGLVEITARDTITINGESRRFASGVTSALGSEAEGNSEGVRIMTGSLTLTNGGQVNTTTYGLGNAGLIEITARDTITFDGASPTGSPSGAGSQVFWGAKGNSGGVKITTGSLTLTNGGVVEASTFGLGTAGLVEITATDTITFDGESPSGNSSGVFSRVFWGVKNSEGVKITTGSLTLTNGGRVSASTFAQGTAGKITIQADDTISADGETLDGDFSSGIFSTAGEFGQGKASDININTNNLFLTNNAEISVQSEGQGSAGSLVIQANELALSKGASLLASTPVSSDLDLSSIFLTTDILTLRDNSTISAEATKNADGGNVNIDSKFIIAFPNQNNDIIARASQGEGGRINITTEAIFGLEERSSTPANETNDIDASSEFGLSGTVNITRPDIDPTSGLLDLTEEVVNASDLITQNVCTQTANSEFIDIGKGGLPQNPEYALTENVINVGLVAPVTVSEEKKETVTEIIEVKPTITRKPPAEGWIFHENGIVELVAYNPNELGEQRTWDNHRGCQN